MPDPNRGASIPGMQNPWWPQFEPEQRYTYWEAVKFLGRGASVRMIREAVNILGLIPPRDEKKRPVLSRSEIEEVITVVRAGLIPPKPRLPKLSRRRVRIAAPVDPIFGNLGGAAGRVLPPSCMVCMDGKLGACAVCGHGMGF